MPPFIEASPPLKGWITDCPYSKVPDGYTEDLFNVLPTDPFRTRIRMGTRSATNRCYDFDILGSPPYAIQKVIRCIAYQGSPAVRVDQVLIVVSGKIYYLVSGGTTPAQITLVNGGSSSAAVLNTTGNVEAVQLGKYAYFVDGTNYVSVDLSVSPMNIITPWGGVGADSPKVNVTNTIGGVVHTAKLIGKYGARIVLSGVTGKENLWWMSEILDPDNWTPITSSFDDGGPIAASSAPAIGPAGDEIVGMFELGTAGYIFGGKRSLTYLNSDPAIDPTQASLVTLSNTIGLVGSRAWTYGPEKSAYILGQDGLYRVRPNDFNIDRGDLVSAMRLDSFFGTLQYSLLDVNLNYDVQRRGCWIFLNRTDTPANSTHLFYSEQTDGFFPLRFYDPKMLGATTCCQIGAPDGRQQIQLMGYDSTIGYMDTRIVSGVDGYAARGFPSGVNPTGAEADDQKIESYIAYGPIEPPVPGRVLFKRINVELGTDEYLPITLPTPAERPIVTLYGGDTAQHAIGSNLNTAVVSGTQPIVNCGDSVVRVPTATYDGGDSSTTASTYLDGGYAPVVYGTYTSQDAFVTGTSAIYYNISGEYRLLYDDSFIGWFIQFADLVTVNHTTPERPYVYRQTPGGVDVTDNDYLYCINGSLSNLDTGDVATVAQSNFVNTDITVLGSLMNGANTSYRTRRRSNAVFVKVSSTGYPWACERVGAEYEPAGNRRDMVDISP